MARPNIYAMKSMYLTLPGWPEFVFHFKINQTTMLVKKVDNAEIETSTIIKHCKQNLERFKVPIKVEFVPNFPRTEYGKIIRFMLQEKNNGND